MDTYQFRGIALQAGLSPDPDRPESATQVVLSVLLAVAIPLAAGLGARLMKDAPPAGVMVGAIGLALLGWLWHALYSFLSDHTEHDLFGWANGWLPLGLLIALGAMALGFWRSGGHFPGSVAVATLILAGAVGIVWLTYEPTGSSTHISVSINNQEL